MCDATCQPVLQHQTPPYPRSSDDDDNMSNDEKTIEEPMLNNKEVEESKEKQVMTEEQTKEVEAGDTNGKAVQDQLQVEADTAKDAEAAAAADVAPAAPKAVKPTVHKPDFETDVVYLYQFSRTANIPSPSCFCLKVETWLRMSGIKYENVDHKMKFRSSKGQLPFVELNGQEIADSAVIIKEVGKHFLTDMDSHLTPEQRNVAHAMTTMIENHFHWIDVWWRTKNADAMLQAYKIDLQHMMGSKLPQSILKMAYRFIYRRKGLKKVRATGIGLHAADEIVQMGKDDLKVLSDMLGDKPFFFGDDATTLDVVVFANVAQLAVIDKEVAHPLRDWLVDDAKNLVQHFDKIKDKYFPDWQEMCQTLDLNTHLPKPVKEEVKEEKSDKIADEPEKKEEDKEKVEDEKEKEVDEKLPEAEEEKSNDTK